MSDITDASPEGAFPDFDQATADLFRLDLRVGEPDEDLPNTCSADCTNDGCTSDTKC
ncbi:hypothetical protein LO762_07880 [Actinocorallia sp. API 0066]|uniref:hypothetical protein n=1 Tax=Actinocorallia sp. API 0066 TaxID=2896846 RepID=UPI001E5A46FF|nr:hypothetical protein [Actinocorallia sp. API 0066]MCD0449107.1 hypothetical protein [Actinocorallia sp. API 0066]